MNDEKYIVIDERMREFEKEYLKLLGYNLIEVKTSNTVYEEISSHTDIFLTKVLDKELIIAPNINLNISLDKFKKICLNNNILLNVGKESVSNKYPKDIMYNTIILNNYYISYISDVAVHNVCKKYNLGHIKVKQGYSKCSCIVLNNNTVITMDKGIYNTLKEFENVKVWYIKVNKNIKLLLNNGEYSNMCGFIGGATLVTKDKVIVFGDISKIMDKVSEELFRNIISTNSMKLVEFKEKDVIDYGGCIVI